MPLTPERLQDAYRQMLVIRKFEETIRSLYQQGKIRGSFHPCVGQEATAVGGCWPLRQDDYMTCTYRGHGQAIAKGLSVFAPRWRRCWARQRDAPEVKEGPCILPTPRWDCWARTRL